VKAPWAITLAMAFTYVAGFLFNIVLCFVMGNPLAADGILASPLAQPVAQIFYNSLGVSGGVAFTVFAFIILQFVCFTATQALARTVFAFSRDRLLPFSSVWLRVNRVTGTPIYAVWVSVFWCVAINLIGLGSYTAISGVFNITAIALDWSYCIPIFCKLAFGRFERPGPFSLGRAGVLVNAWALVWTAFVSVIFLFPTVSPVSAVNMNYAIAFLGLILLFAAGFWFASGRRNYKGPLVEAEVMSLDSGSTSGTDYPEKRL